MFPNSDSELKGSSRGQKIGPRIRPGGVRASLFHGPGGNGFWPPLSHFRHVTFKNPSVFKDTKENVANSNMFFSMFFSPEASPGLWSLREPQGCPRDLQMDPQGPSWSPQGRENQFLLEWARHARSRGHPVWILLRIVARIFVWQKHKKCFSLNLSLIHI